MRLTLLVMSLVLLTGCSSMGKKLKSFFGGKSTEPVAAQATTAPRYSQNENVGFESQRQYKRMNKERFEEEAEVAPQAGSLWIMEGQTGYLFAQNTKRQIGDGVPVKIEGSPKQQLTTKVKVISRLLERLDNPIRRPAGDSAAPGANPADPNAPAAPAAAGGPPPAPGAPAPAATADASASNKPEPNFPVEEVPTRIVETLRDGSYRVKGMQSFMIGKREYKVIVTGMVRPEDFNDEGISASKLLDPQFDIVSSRKGAM